MKEFKASTKRGTQLVATGNTCYWSGLGDLYDNWSSAKQRAFDWCWEQFCKDKNSRDFGVGNANSFGFTARWLTIIDGENVMRIETKDNSYLVWLNR